MKRRVLVLLALVATPVALPWSPARAQAAHRGPITPDLAAMARRRALRAPARQVSALPAGAKTGVHLSAAEGAGVAWLDGIDLVTGVLQVDVRGEDVLQRSFLGLAFGGTDESTFEAVYLRPFNFAAADPLRRAHAVQYIRAPTYTWSRLRAREPSRIWWLPASETDPAGAWGSGWGTLPAETSRT